MPSFPVIARSLNFISLLCGLGPGLLPVRAAYDPPAGYYSTAAGLSGSALKTALHNRIRGHAALPYSSSSSTDVWDALVVLDADPANGANVRLLYSGESRSKTLQDDGGSTGNWWNREHV